MNNNFVHSMKLSGFLSFPQDSEEITFNPLNVIIGPNGSGKSNLIESFELLKATSGNFAAAIRDGGGPVEWLWKGGKKSSPATIEAVIGPARTKRNLRYCLTFDAVQQRVEVIDEAIEEVKPVNNKKDVFFYYRFNRGRPVINVREEFNFNNGDKYVERNLQRQSLAPDQSVLSQRKDPDLYPEVTWVGAQFSSIQTFREWSIGRYASLRQPQPADLPDDFLLPDGSNLALVLNRIQHTDERELNRLIKKFFPRFERLSTRVSGGSVQFYLHEAGLSSPIPPTRLSDGTIRFLALLAVLLAPTAPPLVCIEEPELGLHPDALSAVADLLRDASTRMQIAVTTQSDVLVSELTECPDTVVVSENVGSGTTLRRLDPEQLRFWLDKYRLGEIWRMGELGGNI
ncbi:MAG: AAA family ATPase [Solirubrobacterales bacterium]